MPHKKIQTASIITFGCKVNQKDSEEWLSWLLQHNIEINDANPDAIFINTCTVTNNADKEALSIIKKLRKKHPSSLIIATGCGVKKKDSLFNTLEEIDYIIPDISENSEISHLFSSSVKKTINILPGSNRTRALVKIQEGCENYCSFCIVPFVRGNSRSKSEKDIIQEIQEKEAQGFLEVVITGINIGAYGASNTNKYQETKIATLLQNILQETSIPRIRISSLGPQYFSPKLIDVFTHPRICNHIHLSIQSGSNNVLEKMNRCYKTEDIIQITEILKKKAPLIAFTADIIVGFPGETEQDFLESCTLSQKIPLSKIHVFPYSIRTGTVAGNIKDQISEQEKIKRAKYLRSISGDVQQKFLENMIGKKVSVLFEQKHKNPYQGWSTNYCKC